MIQDDQLDDVWSSVIPDYARVTNPEALQEAFVSIDSCWLAEACKILLLSYIIDVFAISFPGDFLVVSYIIA